MRKLMLQLLLAGISAQAFPAERITVQQLEQVLAAAQTKPDADVARQLSGLELAERPNTARLLHWEAQLPGPKSRQVLMALADVSAFLDLPPAEIPATAAPDLEAQRQMMARTADYVARTIHQLPNFFATRITTTFQDAMTLNRNEPLHPVATSSVVVLYRDGREVVDSAAVKSKKSEPAIPGLTTWGVFGPILGVVLVDAGQGKLAWSHWDRGATGPQAVFRYTVQREKSHYKVSYCCVRGESRKPVFQQFPGYHGEFAIDPADGTILRVTLEADLDAASPIVEANVLVEYGPEEIGEKTYICPVRSVSIQTERVGSRMVDQDLPNTPESLKALLNVTEPEQTLLNDVVFLQYHLFRSPARVVTGKDGNAH
jgi:hypothetical protein